MSMITICDLEVRYHVGVPDVERASPQRLLITLELDLSFERCAVTDDVADTVNYFEVCQVVLGFGKGRSWKTIEKLAFDLAETVLTQLRPTKVKVEVKKLIIPETKYVSVKVSKP